MQIRLLDRAIMMSNFPHFKEPRVPLVLFFSRVIVALFIFLFCHTPAADRSLVATINGHSRAVNTISISPDGKFFVTGSADSTIRVWDISALKEIRRITGLNAVVLTTTFAKGGSNIVSGGMEPLGRVWDFTTGFPKMTLGGHAIEIRTLAYSEKKKYLATGSTDRTVIIWDYMTFTKLKTLTNKLPVITMDFSPNGNYLATGGWEHLVQIWDLTWRDVCKTCQGHTLSVRSVKFTPDGLLLASGSEDQSIRIWNPVNTECKEILYGHQGIVTVIDFSPDGRLLASASFDGTVEIWDTYSWQSIRSLIGHQQGVSALAFSKDGKRIITGDDGGIIKIWLVEPINHQITELLGQKKKDLTAIKADQSDKSARKIEVEKRRIEDEYAKKIDILKKERVLCIQESVKPVSIAITNVGNYNQSTQTMDFFVRDLKLSVKLDNAEARLLLANWYKLKANGYIRLEENLLRYCFLFAEIEYPETGQKYKVVKQSKV